METGEERRRKQEQTAIVCAIGILLILLIAAVGQIIESPQLILERLAWVRFP